MVGTVIKKIIQQIPKVVKKVPKKKLRKVDPKSPFAHVDELARPLHRGAGPSGVQKKKLKEAGERISKWFRKQEGKGPVRKQPKLPHLKKGGLIRGFPKVATKGWK
jgi:hypothetical protein|tara:strand:+ start:280 stop:597 length:318 start_codon:yes stop_codon:yes gene_type:complete